MNPSHAFRLLLALGALSTLAAGARTPPPQSNPCKATAAAARKAAERDAYASFFNQVAMCLNEEPGAADCMEAAQEELEETLELAREQYLARLEVCELLGQGKYDPQLDPADFTPHVTATFSPFVPGRTLIYEKPTPRGLEHVEVTALPETVEIAGFECRAVSDVVLLDGELVEDTVDWFSQDPDGNLWYFGEIAQNFEDGLLSDLDGSWKTGQDGARPGIVMLATPAVGDAYRQEFLINEAEDLARVVSLGNTVVVPAGTFHGCLETEDFSPLEPGVLERKFYAPGVGLVLELDLETGERLELIAIQD